MTLASAVKLSASVTPTLNQQDLPRHGGKCCLTMVGRYSIKTNWLQAMPAPCIQGIMALHLRNQGSALHSCT